MSGGLYVGKPANEIPPGQRCANCGSLIEEEPDADGNPYFCLVHEERMGRIVVPLYWCGEWKPSPREG